MVQLLFFFSPTMWSKPACVLPSDLSGGIFVKSPFPRIFLKVILGGECWGLNSVTSFASGKVFAGTKL